MDSVPTTILDLAGVPGWFSPRCSVCGLASVEAAWAGDPEFCSVCVRDASIEIQQRRKRVSLVRSTYLGFGKGDFDPIARLALCRASLYDEEPTVFGHSYDHESLPPNHRYEMYAIHGLSWLSPEYLANDDSLRGGFRFEALPTQRWVARWHHDRMRDLSFRLGGNPGERIQTPPRSEVIVGLGFGAFSLLEVGALAIWHWTPDSPSEGFYLNIPRRNLYSRTTMSKLETAANRLANIRNKGGRPAGIADKDPEWYRNRFGRLRYHLGHTPTQAEFLREWKEWPQLHRVARKTMSDNLGAHKLWPWETFKTWCEEHS